MEFEDARPLRRADALAVGITDAQLRALYTRGGWTKIGHGLYLPESEQPEPDRPEILHRAKIDAIVGKVSPDAVASHQSAAVLYGLPLWNTPLDLVHLTRGRRNGGRTTTFLKVHTGYFDDNELGHYKGLGITSLVRTVIDLARTLPFEQAVVAGDAAIHGVGDLEVTTEQLRDELVRMKGVSGVGAARRVIEFLDGLCESPGESRSRVLFDRVGLEPPGLQGEVHDQRGAWVGRCDFFWEKHGVIGEFDGKDKYGILLKDGEDPAQAVFAEKARANLMRAAGFHVVRWGWDDLENPDALVAELRSLMIGCMCTRPAEVFGRCHRALLTRGHTKGSAEFPNSVDLGLFWLLKQ